MVTEMEFVNLPVTQVELPGYLHMGIPGPKGEKGDPGTKGDRGEQGAQGESGENGAAFVPGVDGDGILSWENDRNLPNPESVDLKPLLEKVVEGKLPGVTEADDGKVLSVENGRYTVKKLSGGASSWEDLTDKPFYEEGSRVDIFQEQDVEGFAVNANYGMYYQVAECAAFTPAAGETYRIFWDGQTWDCLVYDVSAVIPNCMALGNGTAFGYPGNNEPFIIASNSTNSLIDFFALDAEASHRIGISKDITVIKTLDERFLPMEAIDERIEEYISAALEGDY